MKNFRIILVVTFLALLLLTPLSIQAIPIDVGFQRVTNNNVENLGGQLGLQIMNSADAFILFGETITDTQVLFAYTNDVGIASNIAEIYIDDGTVVTLDSVINSLTGFTNFTGGSADPGNLPGGNTLSPPFVATSNFSADLTQGQGGTEKGINESLDTLGIVYSVTSGLAGIQAALDDGTLRVGLHIRSIGTAGGSDSYVNNGVSVPEPATILLLGFGLAGFLGFGRKKFKKLR